MTYRLIDHNGNDVSLPDLETLRTFLSQPPAYWRSGSGDSAVLLSDSERLLFFKLTGGIFILQHPDYLVPLLAPPSGRSVTLSHAVGGEALLFPESALHSEQQAFEILAACLRSGTLAPRYHWTDLYDLDFDHPF
ncbi:hypothetical protein A6D6_03869 [Alcanivorax xiamenensis]|uniref:Tir chaperone protein (CesT) family protein n=1 Tax=Alcanivorax xiamenensis TaxID=1177156 RepID=A0ABQ6Y374_9GAMM|nr:MULTISPECIES: hypothetical protein [Alcanivorax]KAF0802960.1 hypothetical protein A6D6_03869 [Alcanivorax xiamenensis]